MAVSMLWSPQPRWESTALWLIAGVAGWFVAQLNEAGRKRVPQLVGLLLMATCSAVVLIQWLLDARGMDLHAGFGNPNWLGISIAVSLPFGVTAARLLRPPIARWAAPLWTVTAVIAVLLTHAGTAMVALVVVGLVMLRQRQRLALLAAGCKRCSGADDGPCVAFGCARFLRWAPVDLATQLARSRASTATRCWRGRFCSGVCVAARAGAVGNGHRRGGVVVRQRNQRT